jgi:hypothetical protein
MDVTFTRKWRKLSVAAWLTHPRRVFRTGLNIYGDSGQRMVLPFMIRA